MIIGQLGIGLALKTFTKKTNLGWIIASALFLDILLWIFILLGFEEYTIPSNYEKYHYLYYVCPYSHGLAASLFWAFLFYVGVISYTRRIKIAIITAIGVFSHFILDIIVHPPEIPLLFENSYKLGFGLCNHIYLAFGLELIILFFGLLLYYQSSYSKTYVGKYGLFIFIIILIYIDFGQHFLLPDSEDYIDTALSSLLSLIAVIAITFWLDKKRSHKNYIAITA